MSCEGLGFSPHSPKVVAVSLHPILAGVQASPQHHTEIRDVGILGRAADYGGGASGSLGIKDDSNRSQTSAAPVPVMADEALVVRGAPQDPGPVKTSPRVA